MYVVSALVAIAGAASYVVIPSIAPYIFSVGGAGVVIYRIATQYTGNDFRKKRLQRMFNIATMLYILVAYLMFTGRNYWVAVLVFIVVVELVVSFRMDD